MTLVLALLLAVNWPAFRGPNASGSADTSGLPVEFGPGKNVAWKTPLAAGTSSPVLTGERIFLTGHEGSDLITYALDRMTGKVIWRRTVPQPRRESLHKLNSPAAATPVTDGGNVYAFFGDFGLVSYGPDGQERWRLPLGPFDNLHGMAASPVLADEKLILVCDQDTKSFLLAVHKNTGKEIWRTPREMVVHGHATPSVWRPAGGSPAQIIVPGSYMLASYSAADGKELWTVRGLSWQIKTTAVIHGGMLFTTGWAPGADPGQAKPLPPFEDALKVADANKDGKLANDELTPEFKHGGSWRAIDLDQDGFLNARDWTFYRARRSAANVTMALRLDPAARGDLTDTHVVWKHPRFVPQVSSPLLHGGLLYTIKDGGILTAMDAATGEIRKTARVTGALGAYYASPVAGDGKIYVLDETGKVAVIRPGADWEPLAVNDLEEPLYATPALADGRIYLRTPTALYCFAKP